MSVIAMAVHGGASEDSIFLQQHRNQCEHGLGEAINSAYHLLETGGTAIDAVEIAVKILEDNDVFNAGKGSALNCNAEVEMDASIMEGKHLKAGAVSMVQTIKNPVSLARLVMEKTNHVFLSGYGAIELADYFNLPQEPHSYFITSHQLEELERLQSNETFSTILNKKKKGTVGAVALDRHGNIAAATSTGGISNSLPGRIGDSCIIGAGCYANNATCAVSGTGEGEFLIRQVVAHSISNLVEQGMRLIDACKLVVHQKNTLQGEIGVISVNPAGEIGIAFNTQIMKRAWKSSFQELQIKIEV